MRILLIEDDLSLRRAVEYRLKKEGIDVACVGDGASGLEALMDDGPFDLVLLDRMLPGMEGVELLRRARQRGDSTPVLMLTAMDSIEDRVQGLDAGADDYLVKPFAMDELMARVRALQRRPQPFFSDVLQAGDLRLDQTQMILKCGPNEVQLSRREGDLMAFLMCNKGQLLPRGVIMERVWKESIVEEGNLDITVHFLRKHINELGSGAAIRTVRGVGYRFEETGRN